MRKVCGLPSKEGGYNRTGSRTPMQWDKTTNAGFSSAPYEDLYLPLDEEMMDTINAESEMADKNSLYWEVRNLIAFRREHAALAPKADFTLLSKDYPLVYERKADGETLRIIINPSSEKKACDKAQEGELIYCIGEDSAEEGYIAPESAWIRKI